MQSSSRNTQTDGWTPSEKITTPVPVSLSGTPFKIYSEKPVKITKKISRSTSQTTPHHTSYPVWTSESGMN